MTSDSVTGKNWVYKNYNHNSVNEICEKFSIKEIISRLLVIRKIDKDQIKFFLDPKIKDIFPNPGILKDMDKSINFTVDLIKSREVIGIFGDYDVDGASSTALLINYLNQIKHPNVSYIPDRFKDGYGPTINSFKKIIEKKARLIITVDCGTSSFEPIKYAKKYSVNTIVLDHHQANIELPEAYGIINPNRIDDNSNLNHLCASGITYIFLVALNKKLREINWFYKNNIEEPNLLEYLDLVTLGTICDVVPLKGLNRAFVRQGLKIIKKRKNLGLKTLYDLCNIESEPNAYHVGYILGPKINAGGRVGQSSHGSELLSTNNPERSFILAQELLKFNKERQFFEKKLLEQVEKEALKSKNDPVLILSGNNWHEGIIGIVAARIKEKFNKPAIIISLVDNVGKGSARSVLGFDIGSVILSALQHEIIIKGGGHKMAGGFSIDKEKIDIFRDFVIKKYLKMNLDSSKLNNFYIDAIIAPSALNEDFYEDINSLSPFGSGNYEPNFVIENVKVANSNFVGEKHIKSILFSPDGSNIRTIAFNSKGTEIEAYLSKNNKKSINIAGKMSSNEWKGRKQIEFVINDISVNKN